MKFMLLFYNDGRLRVVIMSANFMAHDFDLIDNVRARALTLSRLHRLTDPRSHRYAEHLVPGLPSASIEAGSGSEDRLRLPVGDHSQGPSSLAPQSAIRHTAWAEFTFTRSESRSTGSSRALRDPSLRDATCDTAPPAHPV